MYRLNMYLFQTHLFQLTLLRNKQGQLLPKEVSIMFLHDILCTEPFITIFIAILIWLRLITLSETVWQKIFHLHTDGDAFLFSSYNFFHCKSLVGMLWNANLLLLHIPSFHGGGCIEAWCSFLFAFFSFSTQLSYKCEAPILE